MKRKLISKVTAFVLSAVMTGTALFNEAFSETLSVSADNVATQFGDINGDGNVDVLDSVYLKGKLLNQEGYASFNEAAADLDEDGSVTTIDLAYLNMYLTRYLPLLPSEMKIDTDGDGLCDYLEANEFKTNPEKSDTDGDSLSDYQEIFFCNTDPLKPDTDDNGINDADEDFDKDGLTNKEELALSTNPMLSDSDEDGLSDGDEVNKYKTDPLSADTDEDGLLDNEELILGINPTMSSTDGTPDNERIFKQAIKTDDFSEINTEESPYKFSAEVEAAGYAQMIRHKQKWNGFYLPSKTWGSSPQSQVVRLSHCA